MRVLLIDFNDSFTAILAQSLRLAGHLENLEIKNIDFVFSEKIVNKYDGVVLGPGPGYVEEYTFVYKIIEECIGNIPVLGICLGHQIISKFFGAKLKNLNTVNHGSRVEVFHFSNTFLFNNISTGFKVGLYHSWVVEQVSPVLQITSVSAVDNLIMSVRHKEYPIEGLQFHPESYMTEYGNTILKNWLYLVRHNTYDKNP